MEPKYPEQMIFLILTSICAIAGFNFPWFLGVCCVLVQFCLREMQAQRFFFKPNNLLGDRTQVQSYPYLWLLVIHEVLQASVPFQLSSLLCSPASVSLPVEKHSLAQWCLHCCFLHRAHILSIYNSKIFRKKWQFLFYKIKSVMTCVNYSSSLTHLPGRILLQGF